MAIIKDYMNGPCHIIVHDDSIEPPEGVKRRIDRVSEIVINEEIRRHMQQLEKEKASKAEKPDETPVLT